MLIFKKKKQYHPKQSRRLPWMSFKRFSKWLIKRNLLLVDHYRLRKSLIKIYWRSLKSSFSKTFKRSKAQVILTGPIPLEQSSSAQLEKSCRKSSTPWPAGHSLNQLTTKSTAKVSSSAMIESRIWWNREESTSLATPGILWLACVPAISPLLSALRWQT